MSRPLNGPRSGRGVEASIIGPRHPLPRVEASLRLPRLAGASPGEIRRRIRHTILETLIDSSGSTLGTDPRGVRFTAVHALIDLMRRHGGGRVGVVHWGEVAPAELAFSPVSVYRSGRLHRALSLRPQLGGTDPAQALARARQLVPTVKPDETLVILLVTDGQDVGTSTAEELALLPPGVVHVVLVDETGENNEANWKALRVGSITRLPNFDNPAEVAWANGAVLAKTLGLVLPRRPSRSIC
jgi:hypothetical protein